jgi:hypothetical protein
MITFSPLGNLQRHHLGSTKSIFAEAGAWRLNMRDSTFLRTHDF